MRYQVKSYLKFFLSATNKHGVHSPFVYDLITKCFNDPTPYPEYTILSRYRNRLLKSKSHIEVTDFGAGSRVFTSNKRAVRAIAKNAGITTKRQRLLFRLVRYFQPNHILELGTSLGLGTAALALGNTSASITTVEGCSNTAKMAQELFEEFELQHIQLKNETFETFFENPPHPYPNLVYIDGNHCKERTLQYFERLLPQVQNDSVFIFDDIYWSPEMTEAWKEICAHPDVRVSLDTFQWGLIFFRKEQEKQHFRIRL